MLSYVLVFSGFSALSSFAGAAFPLAQKKLSRIGMHRLMALASGILLGTAFIHMIPQGISWGKQAFSTGLVCSFLFIFLTEQFYLMHACPEPDEECTVHALGFSAFLAFLIHSLIDGLALSTSFTASASLGILTASAVLVHKFPDGLSTATVLLSSGYRRRSAFWYLAAVSLATPVGAILSYFFVVDVSRPVLTLLLGVSCGSFIYIGASDLLPRIHEQRDLITLFSFSFGILLMLGASFLELV